MKIATYKVNGINGRLPRLLEWLEETQPDVACLQELKTSSETFPIVAIREAGYGAVWAGQKSFNGVAILARDATPQARLSTLPGGVDDTHSRYIEAEVDGVIVASLYLPNGNPQPGSKFDYKLAWFERFNQHAKSLLKLGQPVVLAGDYNVVPTDFDIYDTRSWLNDALLQPESRAAYAALLKQGWTDASASTRSGTTCATAGRATPACASTTCCCRPTCCRTWSTRASTASSAARTRRATTRRPG